ncbi:hypothetical protein ONS95_012908 [Cadophora gregata]|uniref:uncharacterized protein n=1 Tax=Cadophora gregata TaxID=51156 RepID=UPI0026DD5808|nr:uncharacterized protein ONS95_012908 [Cadophora gregata]KAK0101108.1 hypothetical protein ONS96_006335 [Cadophora gregata f. sp. sojae]KAK0115860.1 hypothetical protein ONS95_012908 [Cadophora gregata]
MYCSFVSFALLGLAGLTTAAENNPDVTFLYPAGPGLVLNYMDTVNVTYTSPFARPLLYTFCKKPTVNRYSQVWPQHPLIRGISLSIYLTELIQHVAPKNGSTLVLLGWSDVNSCYFDLRPTNKAGNGSNSNYFSVIPTARTSPILVGLNQNGTTTPAAPTNTVTISPDSSEVSSGGGGGLSSGAKIGIGVGVALGVVVLGLAVGAYLLRRRKQKKTEAGRQLLNVDNESAKSEFGAAGQNDQFVHMHPMASELQGKSPVRQTPQELPGDSVVEMDSGDRTVGELSAESEVGEAHGRGRNPGVRDVGNTG